MGISLCMIAKNEEEYIKKSLESIKELVDEIILVDTGSEDKTIEIAKNYGAKIIESTWKSDFSYHRNQSIKMATKEWILFLDCDEVVVYDDLEYIKSFLEKYVNSKYKAFNVSICNVIGGVELVEFRSLRIFRNGYGFKFEKPIHEQVYSSIANKFGNDSIGEMDLKILHYGYDEKVIVSKNKVKRNLDILNNISEKTAYDYAMIGDEYMKANMLNEAVIYYEKCVENNNINIDENMPMVVVSYISALINLGKYEKAISVISKVRTNIFNFSDLVFFEFWIYYQSKKYSLALDKLKKYTSMNSNSDVFSVKRFDKIYDLDYFKRLLENMIIKGE